MATKGRKIHDRAEIVRAYDLLFPQGQVTELRALDAQRRDDYRPGTLYGYFDHAEALADAAATITTAKGVYIIPNAVNPELLARACNRLKMAGKGDPSTSDGDIVRRRWLLIDADPDRPTGISSTDTEHAAALTRVQAIVAYLQDLGWPMPVIVADSGNGAHAMCRIDLPADDGGLVQRCLQALAARFDDAAVKVDQSVFNPARIWKLYGTTAAKGDDVPNRPWRMARIIDAQHEGAVVPIELLQALAAEIPDTPPAAAGVQRAQASGDPFDVAEFVRRHGLEIDGPSDWTGKQGKGRRWVFRQSPLCEHHEGAAHIEQHASGAITAGCHHNSCSWTWHDLRQRFEPRDERPVNMAGIDQQAQRTAGNAAKPAAVRPAAHIAAYRPFPVDALPGPLDAFTQAAAAAMGCDASYIALPLLVTMAAAIGSTRRIILKRGWTEPAILWAAIVGESGTTKSPAFKLVMRPVRDLQAKSLALHAEAMRQHETALARFEKELAKWKKDKGDSDPPDRPEQPQAVRHVVQDTTVEALAPLLLANTRGLLLARDELAGWLGSFDRYSGGSGADAAAWLSMHGGDSLIVDRKTGAAKTLYVPQAYVSVVGGIQPGILNRALGTEHRESGLAARLLLTCPPRRPKRWSEADIDPAAEVGFGRLLARLYELQPTTEGEQSRPMVVGMNSDAKRAWVAYYDAHGQEQVDMGGELAAAWSKLEAYAARLALVIHYARWAADDFSLHHPDQIDADSMARAVTLAQWFKGEARRVYGMLGESDGQADTRHLVEWIERKGGAVSARDLQQGPRQYRTSQDAAEAALDSLVKAGLGTWQNVPTTEKGGRPGRVFLLGNSGNGYTTPTRPEEKPGSVAVASVAIPETQNDDWGEV